MSQEWVVQVGPETLLLSELLRIWKRAKGMQIGDSVNIRVKCVKGWWTWDAGRIYRVAVTLGHVHKWGQASVIRMRFKDGIRRDFPFHMWSPVLDKIAKQGVIK